MVRHASIRHTWKFLENYRGERRGGKFTREFRFISERMKGSIYFHYESRSRTIHLREHFLSSSSSSFRRTRRRNILTAPCNLWSAARSAEPHLASRKPAAFVVIEGAESAVNGKTDDLTGARDAEEKRFPQGLLRFSSLFPRPASRSSRVERMDATRGRNTQHRRRNDALLEM